MQIITRNIVTIILALLLLSLAPAVARTLKWGSDADGLTTLAMSLDEDYSFNPWRRDSTFISSDMAVWVLATYDWPYRNRNSYLNPPLHQAISAHGLVGVDPLDTGRIQRLVRVLIERGEPIDEYSSGYTPLLLAILHCDYVLVELLVNAGADLGLAVDRPGSRADGLSAVQFARLLNENENYCSNDIYPFLLARSGA